MRLVDNQARFLNKFLRQCYSERTRAIGNKTLRLIRDVEIRCVARTTRCLLRRKKYDFV